MFRLSWHRISSPRVSVAIPLYNHAAYIERAVASVLEQGPIVREIVVIDDSSTDDSAAVMERLAARDARIRFRRQANQGAHATLNTALAACAGDLIAVLNSDDTYAPGRLAALAAVLDADPDAALAASGLITVDEADQPVPNEWLDAARAFYALTADLGTALLNGNFIVTTSNFLMRREAWQALGGFAALRYTHDLDWLLRALALGYRIALDERPLLRYRRHSTNTIAEDHNRVRAEWAMVAAGYLSLLWDRPGPPPIDWDEAAAVTAVLRTHQLDRAVALVMAYLRRIGAAPLDRAALLADTDFTARVREWV